MLKVVVASSRGHTRKIAVWGLRQKNIYIKTCYVSFLLYRTVRWCFGQIACVLTNLFSSLMKGKVIYIKFLKITMMTIKNFFSAFPLLFGYVKFNMSKMVEVWIIYITSYNKWQKVWVEFKIEISLKEEQHGVVDRPIWEKKGKIKMEDSFWFPFL